MTLAADIASVHVGASYAGINGARLASGRGTYLADITFEGMLHMAIIRSPHAHARIVSIDVEEAMALPGVVYAVTGEEIKRNTRPIPEGWDTAAVGALDIDWYALCTDRARYVGEAVAAIVAESKYVANRAAELVRVEYEILDAVLDVSEALADDTPLVEPRWGTNLRVSRDLRTGDLGAAQEESTGVVRGRVVTHRTTGVPLETRGCLAFYDVDDGRLTLWDSTQQPHVLRVYLSQTIELPESRIRVIQPDVGGAFGLKVPPFQEEPLIAYLAMVLKRPIKWVEERSENFQATGHARDMQVEYEAWHRPDGTVTGIDIRIIADVGAPTALVGWGMAFSASGLIPGPYRVPNTRVRLDAVVTNTCPWNSYRGFGKDVANLWLERIMDDVARSTGLSRTAVRLRNFIGPDEFPFSRERGGILGSGDYPRALTRALELVDEDAFRSRQEAERARGRHLGLGLAFELTPEGCAMPGSVGISGYDGATVRVTPSGEVTVLSGVTSPGSGNETALAQIAADAIGCAFDDVRVLQGDTDVCPWGLGNFSSRSVIIGGSAVQMAASDLREKLLVVAANMLEASPQDLRARNGQIEVKGVPSRGVSITDVAREIYTRPHGPHAGDVDPALESTRYFRAPNIYHQPAKQGRFSAYPTWPNAATACIVEVDIETGMVKVLEYYIVEDAGVVINPRLVDANLHGATAQALGGALYENLVYDEHGQLATATLMDYTIPTAVEMPRVQVEHQEIPSPFTPLGTKGAGESGLGCALGAVVNAVEDALPDLDLRIEELPMTPSRLWRAIKDAPIKNPRDATTNGES